MFRRSTLLGLLLVLPQLALAYQDPDFRSVISTLGSGFVGLEQGNAGAVLAYIAGTAVPLINSVCILMCIISGIAMTFSQSEEQATVARRTIITCFAAIAVVYTAQAISSIVYTPEGTGVIQDPSSTASNLATEVYGLIYYAETPMAIVVVLMIIISGIRAVLAYGSDDGIAQIRRTVFSIVGGMALILFKLSFASAITITGRPEDTFLAAVLRILNYVLTFVGLVSVIMIVIAGIMMIVNIGNDEQYQKARTLIIRVGIGIVVVLASMAIANIVYFGTIAGPGTFFIN